jgi:hypothetical protein
MPNIIPLIDNLQETWTLLFPGSPVPDQRQFAIWLTLHPEQTVREAIAKLAIKQNGTAPATNLDRFASSIMQRIDSRRDEKVTPKSQEDNRGNA